MIIYHISNATRTLAIMVKMLIRTVVAFGVLLAMCGLSKAAETTYSCSLLDNGDDIGKITFTIDATEERVFVKASPRDDSSTEAQDVEVSGDDVRWATQAITPGSGDYANSTYSFSLSKMSGTWSGNDVDDGIIDKCEPQ